LNSWREYSRSFGNLFVKERPAAGVVRILYSDVIIHLQLMEFPAIHAPIPYLIAKAEVRSLPPGTVDCVSSIRLSIALCLGALLSAANSAGEIQSPSA